MKDELDQLLEQATWPKADDASARLAESWERMTRRRWGTWASLVAAAAIVMAMGVTWMVVERSGQSTDIVAEAPVTEEVEQAAPISRPPTARELMLVRAIERAEARASRGVALPPPRFERVDVYALSVHVHNESNSAERQRLVVKMLESPKAPVAPFLWLVRNEDTRAEALAALHQARSLPIDALLLALDDPHMMDRDAAAVALGEIDGPIVTRRLITMVRADQNRREAYIALASSRGREARAFVRQAAASDALASWAQSIVGASVIR